MASRLSYDLSCARLRELGLLDGDSRRPTPERLPRHDDNEPLGFSVFRTRLADALDLSDLTLPRTFFGRSEINRVSFRNFDLRESNLCWNDFLGTDFSGADLAGSDMRSSLFQEVVFVTTNLNGADLRRSSFINCGFKDAVMKGVVLTCQQADTICLSKTQRQDIDWRDENGAEPDGG
jgi:uncharacterized protein YjbI with pentapeptide repeats